MNKKLIGFVMILTLPLAVLAGPGGGSREGHWRGPKIERLAEKLGLTDEQKGKVEAIFSEQGAKHRAIREETRTRLQSVLTPEQVSNMDALRQRRFERRHGQKPCEKP